MLRLDVAQGARQLPPTRAAGRPPPTGRRRPGRRRTPSPPTRSAAPARRPAASPAHRCHPPGAPGTGSRPPTTSPRRRARGEQTPFDLAYRPTRAAPRPRSHRTTPAAYDAADAGIRAAVRLGRPDAGVDAAHPVDQQHHVGRSTVRGGDAVARQSTAGSSTSRRTWALLGAAGPAADASNDAPYAGSQASTKSRALTGRSVRPGNCGRPCAPRTGPGSARPAPARG